MCVCILGNSKTSASVESEHALHLDTHDTLSNSKQLVNTNSNKHCVVYPQMFKYDIDRFDRCLSRYLHDYHHRYPSLSFIIMYR